MIRNSYEVVSGKKYLGLALTLVLALLLGVFTAGCGNTQAAGGENNSLTISVVTKDMYLDTVVNKFKELHPDVSVEVKEYTSNPLPPASGKGVIVRTDDPGDIEKYVTAMNTQLMSGQGSDILLLNNLPYETYADKNLLVDLGRMMQSDQGFDSSKYYQNVLEALKYKGNLYGLPVSFSIDMIAADKTLLENSQVKIDDNTWDWNDFVKTAEKVINDNKTGGPQEMYALAGMDEKRLISSLVKENYNKLVDPEKKTANFTGKEFLDLLNLSKYLIDHKLVNTDTTQDNMMDLDSRGKQPPTQEEINFVENLLGEANIYNGTDQKIISIVQEETTAFFTGQKTAEMTAQLIQDRVSS